MDEEFIAQLIQGMMGGEPEPAPEVDPRAQAQAVFLSRLAQQDVTSPSRHTPREGRTGVERVTDFTSFADLGDIFRAIEERDPKALGGAALLALLGVGAGGIGRRALRGRRAVKGARAVPDRPMSQNEIVEGFLERGRSADDIAGSVGRRAGSGARSVEQDELRDLIIEDFLTGGQGRAAVDEVTEQAITERLLSSLLGGR